MSCNIRNNIRGGQIIGLVFTAEAVANTLGCLYSCAGMLVFIGGDAFAFSSSRP